MRMRFQVSDYKVPTYSAMFEHDTRLVRWDTHASLKSWRTGLKVSSNFENGLNYRPRSSLKSHESVHEREIRACCRCVEGEKTCCYKKNFDREISIFNWFINLLEKGNDFYSNPVGISSHGGYFTLFFIR